MQYRQHADGQANLPIQDPHFFLAVHIGAGRHSHKMEQRYKEGVPSSHACRCTCTFPSRALLRTCPATLCHKVLITFVCQRGLYPQVEDLDMLCAAEMKLACHKGAEALRREGVALDAVVAAIAALEVRSEDQNNMLQWLL